MNLAFRQRQKRRQWLILRTGIKPGNALWPWVEYQLNPVSAAERTSWRLPGGALVSFSVTRPADIALPERMRYSPWEGVTIVPSPVTVTYRLNPKITTA